MDEHLDAMRALWSTAQPEYQGQFVDFAGINAFPRLWSPGGLIVVLGGDGAPARGRAIRKAHGWYCFNTTIQCARDAMRTIRAELDQQERATELGPLEVTMTAVGPFDVRIAQDYQALGVDRLVLLPGLDVAADRRHEPVAVDEILRTIDRLAEISQITASSGS